LERLHADPHAGESFSQPIGRIFEPAGQIFARGADLIEVRVVTRIFLPVKSSTEKM
jgi:hypothetical protein